MNSQTDPALRIQSRIARRRDRIAKWDKEAADVETSWTGGPDYIKFCEGMAGAARETKAELEAALKHLQGNDIAARQEGESTMSDQSHDLQAQHPK